MTCRYTDPEARTLEVWWRSHEGQHWGKLPRCLMADEETGVIEFILVGPGYEGPNFGIGTDDPLPPAGALPYGPLSGRLSAHVRILPRGSERPASEPPTLRHLAVQRLLWGKHDHMMSEWDAALLLAEPADAPGGSLWNQDR